MPFSERAGELPSPIAEFAHITDEAGGAVLVFDAQDRIWTANEEQKRVMPCCGYARSDTYASFFWSALAGGMTGNATARQKPHEWLAAATATRHTSPNLDFVNVYSWGRMLVSHHRLEDGTSIQARLDMKATGLEHYFEGPEACLGVTRALRLRREIRGLEAALDSLGLAVALVDAKGALLHANSSFVDLLRIADGLSDESGNGIRATDACDELVLRQALGNVAGGRLPAAYAPIRRSHGEPLILSISAGAIPGTAIVASARFGEDLAEVGSALRQALGVTPAEAEVMIGIGLGDSAADLAARRGVSKATTYQQIHTAKASLERSRFARPDLQGIASLVTGIAAATRSPTGRTHRCRKH